jgi:hypothetical protein
MASHVENLELYVFSLAKRQQLVTFYPVQSRTSTFCGFTEDCKKIDFVDPVIFKNICKTTTLKTLDNFC